MILETIASLEDTGCNKGTDGDTQCSYSIEITVRYNIGSEPLAEVECFVVNQVPYLNPVEPDQKKLSTPTGEVTLGPRAEGFSRPS